MVPVRLVALLSVGVILSVCADDYQSTLLSTCQRMCDDGKIQTDAMDCYVFCLRLVNKLAERVTPVEKPVIEANDGESREAAQKKGGGNFVRIGRAAGLPGR